MRELEPVSMHEIGEVILRAQESVEAIKRQAIKKRRGLTVKQAQDRHVCRICEQDMRTAAVRPGNPLLLLYGKEFAHQKCLDLERALRNTTNILMTQQLFLTRLRTRLKTEGIDMMIVADGEFEVRVLDTPEPESLARLYPTKDRKSIDVKFNMGSTAVYPCNGDNVLFLAHDIGRFRESRDVRDERWAGANPEHDPEYQMMRNEALQGIIASTHKSVCRFSPEIHHKHIFNLVSVAILHAFNKGYHKREEAAFSGVVKVSEKAKRATLR